MTTKQEVYLLIYCSKTRIKEIVGVYSKRQLANGQRTIIENSKDKALQKMKGWLTVEARPVDQLIEDNVHCEHGIIFGEPCEGCGNKARRLVLDILHVLNIKDVTDEQVLERIVELRDAAVTKKIIKNAASRVRRALKNNGS